MNEERAWRWLFVLLLVAYAAYAAVFISETIFVADGKPYSALFDDAMISMTYARNLAEGHGPVWNVGDRVEGYSNPLWMVFMAGFHLFPIPENWISLYIQVAGAIFFIVSLFFVLKAAEELTADHKIGLLAVLLTAFYYPLTNWSLLGNEVGLLLAMVSAAVWLALRNQARKRFSPGLYALLGVATLVRMDMAVPYLVILAWSWWFDRANRLRHLVWGVSLLAAFLGGQTLWRYEYYGAWLPMTYYLKMTGLPLYARLRVGLSALISFAHDTYWPLLLFPASVALFRHDRKVLLLALIFAAQCAYSVYVGGDAWEHRGGANRFVSLGMPAFFLLFSLAMWGWFGALLRQATRLRPYLARIAQMLICLGTVAFVSLSLLMMNRLVDRDNFSYDLRHPAQGDLRFFFLMERSIYVPGNERYTRDALIIREVTAPQARVAVVAAGSTAYFMHRYAIDLLGKSDPVVARGPVQVPPWADWHDLRPGHIKFDYAYSLGQLQPDVVDELRVSTYDLGERYLHEYERIKLNGHVMYFKKGSPNILWEKAYELGER
jgi:hypothetical protein